jgi:small nuclear ribonucleoprotein (snRNP)-like protein
MSRSLGIPVKLLHEAAGHVVTAELKTGEVYRGTLVECEDNWNCQLENITFTAKVRAVPCPGSELEPRRFRLRELTGCF